MTNWQPIETAPKDGTEILLAVEYPRAQRRGFFTQVMTALFSKWENGWVATSGAVLSGTATHWMPLPTPPANC